jgi:hypothetical protein
MTTKNMKVFGTKMPILNTVTAALCAGAALLLAGSAPAQTLYISDDNNFTGTIGEYGMNGSAVNPTLITGLGNTDPFVISGNDLFVMNGDTIGEYGLDGSAINPALITGLSDPTDFAVSGNNIFVSSIDNHNIAEYTTSGATVNASLIYADDFYPGTLTISGNNMFVADAGQIGEYTTSGAAVNESLIFLNPTVTSMAISGNDMFVGYGDGNVYGIGEYTTSGDAVNASLISTLGSPAIAISGNDLYVVSGGRGDSIVSEYTTSGATVDLLLASHLYYGGDIAIAPVPEPATVSLAGLSAASLWFWLGRRRK